MILAVRCDRPSFREVHFQPGFNVVMADRTKESTRKDSRNGLGKSTLIEVIHFCLGASTTKDRGLLVKPLLGWTFTLDLALGGKAFSVSRSTDAPSRVVIDGDTSEWPIQPDRDLLTDQGVLPVKDWNAVLGTVLFGLPLNVADSPYAPSFRGLVSYFIRRGLEAFTSPFVHHRSQREWDKQVNNAFLLGLAWQDAAQWQVLKDRKKLADNLKRAARDGMMQGMLGSLGELEATKVRLEEQARQEEDTLRTFRVHPRYREIEQEANRLTEEIHNAVNANIGDRRVLELYEASLREEREPEAENVARVYAEAGVALPGAVVRRLDEVDHFHRQVVQNRRRFLTSEMDRLRHLTNGREDTIREKSERRADLMSILQSHGALDEHARFQEQHLRTIAAVKDLEQRIGNLRRFEEEGSSLRIEQELLHQRARQDYDERRAQRERAIALFNANSEALYRAPGKLVIDIGPNGFRFGVEIERAGSQGIEQMKVFCYDLMLAQLWADRQPSPRLLIHDSTIFADVDERQKAHALELAADQAAARGFQYICMLNSDTTPWKEFSPGFDLSSFVRLTLTDATEDGGLLGIRF